MLLSCAAPTRRCAACKRPPVSAACKLRFEGARKATRAVALIGVTIVQSPFYVCCPPPTRAWTWVATRGARRLVEAREPITHRHTSLGIVCGADAIHPPALGAASARAPCELPGSRLARSRMRSSPRCGSGGRLATSTLRILPPRQARDAIASPGVGGEAPCVVSCLTRRVGPRGAAKRIVQKLSFPGSKLGRRLASRLPNFASLP